MGVSCVNRSVKLIEWEVQVYTNVLTLSWLTDESSFEADCELQNTPIVELQESIQAYYK